MVQQMMMVYNGYSEQASRSILNIWF